MLSGKNKDCTWVIAMLQAPFLAGMEGRVSLNVSIWIGGRLLQAHMDGQVWSTLPEGLNKYVFQKARV